LEWCITLATFQHHQRTELTFHNPYVVPSTVMFRTEFSCWHKNARTRLHWSWFKSSLQKFYGHHNLVDSDEMSKSQMTMDLFLFTYIVFFTISPTRLLSDLILAIQLRTFGLLLRKTFKLFGIPIFRYWAYLMTCILETRRVHSYTILVYWR